MSLLEKNLNTLGKRLIIDNFHTYALNAQAAIKYSKDNSPIPIITTEQQSATLHSMYNASAEAQKITESYHNKKGFYIFLGLGAGYHIREILHKDNITKAIIIENDSTILFELFKCIDYSDIFINRQIYLYCDVQPQVIGTAFKNYFNAIIDKHCYVFPLRSRTNFIDKNYFEICAQIVEATIQAIASDYAVQAQFGYQWIKNIFKNLMQLTAKKFILPKENVLIIGAGPSLEDNIGVIRELHATHWLLATDTSLGCLLTYGVFPDAVISIDCQHYSTMHFLHKLPVSTIVFLDIASPPSLARSFSNKFFFGSFHPLCVYCHTATHGFPLIDCSGGNVLAAACDLAAALGAQSAVVYGADFSYPQGKLYARETYIYNLFISQETKLTPATLLWLKLLFRTPITKVQVTKFNDKSFRYETELMNMYHDALQQKINTYATKFFFHSEYGLPIYDKREAGSTQAIKKITNTAIDTISFMQTYHEKLNKLISCVAEDNKLPELEPETEAIFVTIEPFLAFLVKRNPGISMLQALKLAQSVIKNELAKTNRCCH